MSSGFLIWALVLAAMTFLFWLNSYLQGKLNPLAASFLAIGMFAMVGLAFWIWGWWRGVSALAAMLVLAAVLQAPAARLARRLLRPSK